MAANVMDRRAILLASRSKWSRSEKSEIGHIFSSNQGKCDEDIVQSWLTSISKDDAKPEVALETIVKPVRRNRAAEDDLALGEEASLYSKRSYRTVRDFLRSSLDPPPLSRWNSVTSAVSHQSVLSVMDVLNMWQDDPEELLLDLGFGCEEPDITGRIPARFLNNQSNARGIDFQIFLQAQQSRMDIENPDVRNRFRQLEVLQQVTTTFSSLVGGSAQGADASGISAESRERRKRMGMLLRRASKKSLTQVHASQNQNTLNIETPSAPPPDKKVQPKRVRQGLPENSCLSTLEEEQNYNSEAAESIPCSPTLREPADPLKLNSVPSPSEESPQEPVESFELEEIQSFDEGSVSGNCSGPVDPGGERFGSYVLRTNSCQSDSSGFLEEPFVPALSQQNDPGSQELMKMLNAISQDSTESQQKSVEQQETNGPITDSQNSEAQSSHTDSTTTHSENTVQRTADSGCCHNTEDSYAVLGSANSGSDQHGEILNTKGDASDSESPDVGKVRGSDVYSLAYFVQMDTPDYQTDIWDKLRGLESPDPCVYTEGVSLFEELKYAEINSHSSPTDLGTGVWEKEIPNFTDGEMDQSLGNSASDQTHELTASTDGEIASSNTTFGEESPTALKLRRESFSRNGRSDVTLENDSGTVQTPNTDTPFTSLETSSPHLWSSTERSKGLGSFRMRSMSLDTGLSYDEEDHRWEGALWAGTQQCSNCGAPISCNNGLAKPPPELSSNLPYSLDELEDMMKCMRKFRKVLTEIEGRLEEEQASVIGSLSESHREEVQDVLKLRAAVKQEAGMLEQQLSDLVHHYDDSIKMKLNRLLDEQLELCSQLQITPSDRPRPHPASTRSVGIQCSLPPVTPCPQRCVPHHCTCHGNHRAAWQDSHRIPCQTQWDPNSKSDKLDFVAFIKSLKNSLQHSIDRNSLE